MGWGRAGRTERVWVGEAGRKEGVGEAGVAAGGRKNQKSSEFIGRYRRGVTQRC